mgnify:CR=1 FL=1
MGEVRGCGSKRWGYVPGPNEKVSSPSGRPGQDTRTHTCTCSQRSAAAAPSPLKFPSSLKFPIPPVPPDQLAGARPRVVAVRVQVRQPAQQRRGVGAAAGHEGHTQRG